MTTKAQAYQTILEQLCSETIAAAAPIVDRDGRFPEESIEALKTAGLLGALSEPAVGGLGLGIPGAAAIGADTGAVLRQPDCVRHCATGAGQRHRHDAVAERCRRRQIVA